MSGFTVQLVASSTKTVFGRPLFPAFAYTVPLDGGFAGSLRRLQLLRAIGPFADVVAAAVTYDDPTESADPVRAVHAHRDGVVQPGGS